MLITSPAIAQKKTSPDLATLAQDPKIVVVNRSATALSEGPQKGVRLDQRPGEGLLWLPDVTFTNGSIEFDVRGKDVLQQSFVGIAFHGQNDSTYEAVYFRPFNFRSEDPVRRIHAVQYISHPTYSWQKLRTEFPNKYEAAVAPAPDPNGWFHVRIEVTGSNVRAFVNQSTTAALEVEPIQKRPGNRIGLWVGNASGGDFANLTITPVP
ncbi:hypothetical protein GCM10023189_02400 [Nibrella saemangeumensis]|uniref:3-keto-alpha-glucoside-1,2-lyase/3-keto-2-hydroxy-glucal hydratase domain-containing protein n=1 Tax=Nibrella saemangeumensis TaxID=1084526 RepID=A0ABP8M9D1_9BACT